MITLHYIKKVLRHKYGGVYKKVHSNSNILTIALSTAKPGKYEKNVKEYDFNEKEKKKKLDSMTIGIKMPLPEHYLYRERAEEFLRGNVKEPAQERYCS